MENKNLMEVPYLFYANPTTFPNWKYEERFGIGLDIDKAWYKAQPIWRYKILKGSYKGYVFEISREKAQEVVVRNAIPSGKCHDIIPISEMKAEKPEDNQIPIASPQPLSEEETAKKYLF